MRTVVVFTPTRQYGGLDVTYSAIKRQQGIYDDHIVWIVADELMDERGDVFVDRIDVPNLTYLHFDTKQYRIKCPELRKTYVHAYHDAIKLARGMNADLFISLQDYIVPPVDGFARFLKINKEDPNVLMTGLMSHADDPPPSAIVNPKGGWTIFAEPYDSTPSTIYWHDVRQDVIRDRGGEPTGVHQVESGWFETNFAAIGRGPLHDERLNFSLEFGRGIGYENMDYAAQAAHLGYPVLLDCDNHALGLPHKKYWPEQEIAEAEMNQDNRNLYEEKWCR